MTPSELDEVKSIILNSAWKHATSARYKDSPHKYIIDGKVGPEWQVMADYIRKYGVWRSWHGHRYKYLIIDEYAYWVDWPALNQALENTLDRETNKKKVQ